MYVPNRIMYISVLYTVYISNELTNQHIIDIVFVLHRVIIYF